MKNNVLRQLIMVSKQFLYVFLIQVLSCSFLLANTSNAQRNSIENVHVTFNIKEKPLYQFFKQVEAKTEFKFTYTNNLIDLEQPVTVVGENETLYDVLTSVSSQTKLNFVQVNENIHVKEPQVNVIENSVKIKAPADIVVQGVVLDETNQPLPGVTIVIKGTTLGTTTDLDGSYSLQAPEDAVLVFSFVGFTSQEINVGNRSTIDIILMEDISSLGEVVVVGYGTVDRKDITGSIASVSGSQISEMNGSATRVDAALQGKVAGVDVRLRDGEPGSAPQITIRGLGSIGASSNPLYVVDGFPIEDIGTLNMNDVESIDILKDASATSIYGSRGANGVVIITTKRGKEGKTNIIFDMYRGWQSPMMIRDMMNAQQSAQYFYDGMRNRNVDEGHDVSGPPTSWFRPVGQEVMDVLEGRNTYDVNPLDYVLRNAATQTQYSLSATGGTDKVQFALSGEYLNQEGLIIENDMERISFRANIDAKLTGRLKVNFNLNPSFVHRNRVQSSGHASEPDMLSIIGVATTMHNYFPLFDENGDYEKYEGYSSLANLANPVAIAREIKQTEKQGRILGNLNLVYDLTPDLKFNILLGGNLRTQRDSYFRPDIPVFFGTSVFGSDGTTWAETWVSEYILSYDKKFGKHAISAVGGFTAQKDRVEVNHLESSLYPNNLVPTLNAPSQITSGFSEIYEWSLLSYLARASYNFDSKYYISASIRTDGSSRFGSNNKWGIFPSVGATWRVSDEEFLTDVEFLTDFKFRASYGETGNNNIGNYAHLPTVTFQNYPTGQGFAPAALENPNLRWEKQRQANFAMDVLVLNGRVGLTVEYMRSVSSDLLLNVPVPQITGFSNMLQNIGEVENKGWELVLNTVNMQGKFNWTTDFNISRYRNKVLKLGPEDAPIISGAHITQVGEPIGMFFGYLFDGIFMNQEEISQGPLWNPGGNAQSQPGDIRYVDVSGPEGVPDGRIDTNDKTVMGTPYADFFYGMQNRFSYGDFSLTVSLTGSNGNQILAEAYRSNANTRGRMKQVIRMWDYWQSEENPGDGVTPRPNDGPRGGNREGWSQFQLMDGSYLRINNINFAYQVPTAVVQKYGLGGVKFYYTASNPFIFASKDYNGFNPDVNNSGTALTPGVDINNYPVPKSHIVGINISF
ncbi:SusC/RagA family TonB-linked outer membrane protein [Algoriphagus sp.]|uniref:SusC/RagA family TonB-linked outer membrane protein n=1 Tax=Algoriphagus sp. TaxID=1872435 RepID=UPI003F70160F